MHNDAATCRLCNEAVFFSPGAIRLSPPQNDKPAVADYPFTAHRRVQFSETDAGGIMHFTAYFDYMEQTEHQMLRKLGLGVFMDMDGARISWPRVSTQCNFRRPAVFDDEVTIGIGVRRLGGKSVTYAAVFWRDDELLATGTMVVACCQLDHGQPPQAVPIPASVASSLKTMLIAGGAPSGE